MSYDSRHLGAGWCVGVAYQQRPGSSNGCPIRPDGRNQEQAEWGEPLLVEGTQVAHHTHDREGEISRREEKCPNDLNPKDPRPGFNRRTERRRFLEPPTEADLDEQRLYLIPATLTRGPNSHRLPTDVAGAQGEPHLLNLTSEYMRWTNCRG